MSVFYTLHTSAPLTPVVTVQSTDNRLQVWPSGMSGAGALIMSVEEWRELNAAVEATIREKLGL